MMNICIIANNAYGALTGEDSGHIGGVERQTALFAEWLIKKGHQVSVITWDEGGDKIEYINNIRVIKLCKVTDGLPLLRFITPRWTTLVRALKIADADLYYHNCAEYVTGQISLWCKINKKLFIYSVASDADCDIQLPNLKSKREVHLFRYGLKTASLVITQTQKQKQLLFDNYGIDGRVINMPGTPPAYLEDFQRSRLFDRKKVIWVGRLHKVKRIEWLIDIARQLDTIEFEVIGPVDDQTEYIDQVLPRLKATKNINYLGKISRTAMPTIYQQASLLCCTSIYEGFPNTYLEAWSYGVPVITTIDPDDIIQRYRLGGQAVEQSQFVKQIKGLLSDPERWEALSQHCLNYYQMHHEQEKVMLTFESVFAQQLEYKVKNFFDKQSREWSSYYTDKAISVSHIDLQERLTHANYLLAMLRQVSEPGKLLDLGCGTGDSFACIKRAGYYDVWGVDISPEMAAIAKSRYPEFNFSIANAVQLPFSKGSFNVVLSLGLMEYIPASQRAIGEVRRIMTDQGHLIVSIPNKHSLFRKLRKFETLLLYPVRQLFSRLATGKKPPAKIFHQQWNIHAFTQILNSEGLAVENIRYCTYSVLSPKLGGAGWNISLNRWLTQKMKQNSWLNKYLANTIIIHAKVDAI